MKLLTKYYISTVNIVNTLTVNKSTLFLLNRLIISSKTISLYNIINLTKRYHNMNCKPITLLGDAL